MPSAIIEQLRQQFFASLGINEYTPISDAQAPVLIDQWEQYLFSAAQQQGGYPSGYGMPYQPAPPPRVGVSPVYVPPGQRIPYQPGQIYSTGGGTYVGPPVPGSVVGRPSTTAVPVRTPAALPAARPVAAPAYSGGSGSGSGTAFPAPLPRH